MAIIDPETIARCDAWNEGYKVGIREVVEWVNRNLHPSPSCSYKHCLSDKMWKAKLKKWGVDG